MNGMWGYKIKDQDYKSPCELVRLLVRTAGKGANLLLNIGPQPDGQLPAAALERLEAMGQWLGKYGASIYGTSVGNAAPGSRYDIYEQTDAEGYTWYRIDESHWIPDSGEWLTVELNNS